MVQHYISFPREAEVRLREDGSFVRADRAATRRSRRRLAWGWSHAVILYLAWEAVAYRGLFATAAEWQFDHLGQDFPTVTFLLLAIVAIAPALFLTRRCAADTDHAAAGARDHMHLMFGFASAFAIALAATLAWTLALPTDRGPLRDVSPRAAAPSEGAARIAGTVSYGRVAAFSRGILFLRTGELYAPVTVPGERTRAVRLFVEFPWSERAYIRSGAALTNRTGILVRHDLPGAMVRLYRRLGYDVAPGAAVLHASRFAVRWPYYMAAIQFALAAFAFAIAGLRQRGRAGRIDRIGAQRSAMPVTG